MATKLLLIEDVEDLGRSGDIVSVKPGYARNFLLPQGFGVIAEKNALRMQARLQEGRRKKAIQDKQEAEALAKSFEGVSVSKIVKVDHDGNMYGSVSTVDIVNLVKEQSGLEIEKRYIQLKLPIKETGEFTIILKLLEGVPAELKLSVIAEEVPGALPKKGKAAKAEKAEKAAEASEETEE